MDKKQSIMEKPARPVRNRRNSRKNWLHHDSNHRPAKRLFTPEIKRMLKDWLVRRRENPYPSRDEKKALAIETGLTYTQICNWFANWRRKLKNTSDQKKSWGNLIKNYNTSAKGNVEQFSICSSDSIWGENGDHDSLRSSSPSPSNSPRNYNYSEQLNTQKSYPTISGSYNRTQPHLQNTQFTYKIDVANAASNLILPSSNPFFEHPYAPKSLSMGLLSQCFQISSTTSDLNFNTDSNKTQFLNSAYLDNSFNGSANSPEFLSLSNKYKSHKNHIMEKYLRSFDESNNNDEALENNNSSSSLGPDKPELSKWLESAANFTPSKNSYIDWENGDSSSNVRGKPRKNLKDNFHEKELIAAEALELLANNFRTKFYNS